MSTFRRIAPPIIALLFVANIMLLGIIISRNTSKSKLTEPNVIITPAISSAAVPATTINPSVPAVTETPRLATELGQRLAGSIEDIDLLAEPLTKTDSVAMLRLYVENGEVLDFTAAGYIVLGSCEGNKKFTFDRVCVDIAKMGSFVAGEKLGTLKVKWRENGRIYRESGDGYYNGQQSSLNVPIGMVVSDSGYQQINKAKVAGETTVKDNTITVAGYILIFIGAGLVLVAGVGIYYNLTAYRKVLSVNVLDKSNRNFKIVITAGMLILSGGTLFAANMIANSDQTPVDSSALVTTPIYITVQVTASPTATLVATTTPNVTITNTAVVLQTPVVSPTGTFIPTATATVNPTYFMPTPVTDNIPLVCGPLDVNGDRMLNYIDLQGMMVVYNHQCTDNYPHMGCGGKDTNGDGWVDYRDSYYLLAHYYPETLDCTRY